MINRKIEKQLRKLSKINQISVAKKIRLIKSDTKLIDEKLKGFKNIFRIRVGPLRIVYKKTKSELYIVIISHRKDVYRLVKRLLN